MGSINKKKYNILLFIPIVFAPFFLFNSFLLLLLLALVQRLLGLSQDWTPSTLCGW
jgi:hypothetical protein